MLSPYSAIVVTNDIHGAIEAVWRIESAKLIAALARIVRDVGLAEDLAQDALVIALERWPATGIPDNPAAWLMATAKHRAIDRIRRNVMQQRKLEEIGRDVELQHQLTEADFEAADDFAQDDLLRLIFIACHPVLSREAQVALTLRLIGGLSTDEIARAFLAPEPTIAQRIVRAKRTLAESQVPFEMPSATDRAERMASVLEVIYLIFNEGYAATAGEHWTRPALCGEALRLGRILAGLAPNDGEVHGLLALMELQASRMKARVSPTGEPILLLDQNRARWDYYMIRRGLAALAKAESLGPLGPYGVQASIAACHARARRAEDTNWARIAALYGALVQMSPSPIVELNRAVAVGMADGPAAGLVIADALLGEPALASYHLLPSVRGDLLVKLGRFDEAGVAFAQAASLTRNERERDLLLKRAAACARGLRPAV
jgi:RNA polymerase sigma factor (sigma-70 family)